MEFFMNGDYFTEEKITKYKIGCIINCQKNSVVLYHMGYTLIQLAYWY